MSILNIFNKKAVKEAPDVLELNKRIRELEEKSALNDSLVGIIGNQWLELMPSNNYNNSFDSHYTIYKGIDMLADNIAQLPLVIYRGNDPLPLDFKLPGFDLHNPHPRHSINELIYMGSVYLFYKGEFMLYINLEDGPMYLEVINPDFMTKGNNVWKYDDTKIKKTILDEQLIYVSSFNPDGDRGLSPIAVVKQEIINDLHANNYATKFFENFAQIGGTLFDKDGRISVDDMKNLVDQFNNARAGSKKAYKTLGLPKGIEFKEPTQSMREMEFQTSRDAIRDRVLSVLGIHKALFGVTDQVNRSVSEEASRQMWVFTLKPKAVRIQEKFNQKLFRNYFPQYTCAFDFSVVEDLNKNMDSILNQAKIFKELGYTTNEINDFFDLGMDTVDDPVANTRFVPNNLMPYDMIGFTDDTPLPEIKSSPAEEKLLNKLLEEDIVVKKPNQYLSRFNIIQRKHETRFARAVGKHFSKELNLVIKTMLNSKSYKDNTDLNTLLALIQNTITDNKSSLIRFTEPIYQQASADADALAISAINRVATPTASEVVVKEMTNKVTNISNHTYRLVRTQVKDGINAGESMEQIADRIKQVYKFNASRARTIAQTETATVVNRTTNERYIREGVAKKIWIDTGDGKTRATHSLNGAVGPVPYNYMYSNGQLFPGDGSNPAEVINCRCTFVGIVE